MTDQPAVRVSVDGKWVQATESELTDLAYNDPLWSCHKCGCLTNNYYDSEVWAEQPWDSQVPEWPFGDLERVCVACVADSYGPTTS